MHNLRNRVSFHFITITTTPLQIKPSPSLLHLSLPLPLQRILSFATSPTNTLVHPAQLDVQIRSQSLEADADLFETFNLLSLGILDLFLGSLLVTEDVAVAADHDEVALVVDRHDLTTLDLGLRGVEGVEGFANEETEGGAEVV